MRPQLIILWESGSDELESQASICVDLSLNEFKGPEFQLFLRKTTKINQKINRNLISRVQIYLHPELSQTFGKYHRMRLEILNTAVVIISQTIGGISTKIQITDPKVPIPAAAEEAKTALLTVLLTVSVSVETISVRHYLQFPAIL